MKTHTTNYFNTFIEVAEDCPVDTGTIPPVKANKLTIANLQYDMIHNNPYKYTSDELLFHIHAVRKELEEGEWEEAKTLYFSKGQPCLRSSPLTKRYGWGIHFDEEGRVNLVGMETAEYAHWTKDSSIQQVKAMRSKRK